MSEMDSVFKLVLILDQLHVQNPGKMAMIGRVLLLPTFGNDPKTWLFFSF